MAAEYKIENLEKLMAKWKKKYSCTLGDKAGWCDGNGAVRCPSAINAGGGNWACELKL